APACGGRGQERDEVDGPDMRALWHSEPRRQRLLPGLRHTAGGHGVGRPDRRSGHAAGRRAASKLGATARPAAAKRATRGALAAAAKRAAPGRGAAAQRAAAFVPEPVLRTAP